MLSGECNDKGGRVGQGDLLCDGRPATQGRALQMKEQKDAAKEAFNSATLAQFLFGPGGRQAGAVLLASAGSRARRLWHAGWRGSRR